MKDRVRISRVVTRTGDAGTTALVGGQRVRKDDPRLEAYGTGDELQVALGMARDALASVIEGNAFFENLDQHLIYIQNLLFTFNGELATRIEDYWPNMPLITAEHVEYLEALTAACNAPLPPLKDFIIPGGHPAPTALHLCRVIARRCERNVETLAAAEAIGAFTRPFVNRLSDVFFVLARRVSLELGKLGAPLRETIWTRDLPPPALPGVSLPAALNP